MKYTLKCAGLLLLKKNSKFANENMKKIFKKLSKIVPRYLVRTTDNIYCKRYHVYAQILNITIYFIFP